jgi:hypothetical protein
MDKNDMATVAAIVVAFAIIAVSVLTLPMPPRNRRR